MKTKSLKNVIAILATLSVTALGSHAEELSLAGKTIGVTVVGTSHHWDLQAFKGQTEELERLGATVIALDA